MKKFEIKDVRAREVLDCRLEPTVEVEVRVENGSLGRASVPCGRSTGKHEAVEVRDGEHRYQGKGVLSAVANVNQTIAPELVGREVTNQRKIDELLIELDGTENKSNLGANATTGVSLAVLKAAANSTDQSLYKYIGGANAHVTPVPLLDMIEGGELAATELDFQEHQIIPTGADSFSEAIRLGAEVYYELGKRITDWGNHSLNVGFEGGYTPIDMEDPRDAFDEEMKAIEELGYGDKFSLGLDVAASHFYDEKTEKYSLMGEDMTKEELINFYEDLVGMYPLITIEDPLYEEDFEGFAELTESLGIQIVGDDFFVTNVRRLEEGIKRGAANCLLLKVNQIGTFSEAMDAAELAFRNGYEVQVSERSGQTADTWLADLAVGINAGQIKTGVTRGERTEQYNRLFRIEEELGDDAEYRHGVLDV